MNLSFPDFKKLAQEDKTIIENITANHLPYSDFNFVSLYCWNTDGATTFSLLNNNLIIQMKEYGSDNSFLSFLGNNNVKETIEQLFEYAKSQHISTLDLIPEISIRNYPELYQIYLIEEERDQFDYIYNLSEMVAMDGRVYLKRRNMLRMFEKSYKAILKVLDIRDEAVQKEIIDLCNHWIAKKIEESKYYDKNELSAIKNCFTLADTENFICHGLYIDEMLAAFSIIEILLNDFCIFHFEKTNHIYKGITEYLKVNTAKHLLEKGVKFLNAEQDLGIEGLRRTKLSYNPSTFLKKYNIKLKNP